MLYPQKGRYALRTMIDLGLQSVMVKINILQGQIFHRKVSEQIISILSWAGCVRSVRGNQGGYYLIRPASEYTVGMILADHRRKSGPVDRLVGEDNPASEGMTASPAAVRFWMMQSGVW